MAQVGCLQGFHHRVQFQHKLAPAVARRGSCSAWRQRGGDAVGVAARVSLEAPLPSSMLQDLNTKDIGNPSQTFLSQHGATTGRAPDTVGAFLRLHELCTSNVQPFSEWGPAGQLQERMSQAQSWEQQLTAQQPSLGPQEEQPSDHQSQFPTFVMPHEHCTYSRQSLQSHDPTASDATYPVAPNASSAASSVTTVERCHVSHPGSMCCTIATVEKDPSKGVCVVSLQTSVRVTEASAHVDVSDLEELAWVSVRETASDLVTTLNKRTAVPHGREERHRYICNMLRNGTICDARKMENGFGHVSYVVTLQDARTGKKMRALFKPRVEGDCEGWHRVPVEAAAYQVNLLLGMDYVPPAVFRPDVDVDWTHYPMGGAFIYWCSGSRELTSVPMHEWSVPPPVLLSDTRILDVLIQNSDRHAGHFLYAEHWADGSYGPSGWKGAPAPLLIDQAAGFRPDAFVSLEHENAFTTGPTRKISSKTYLRLRFLDTATLTQALKDYLSPEEIASVLLRRDAILSFFDAQVEQHGFANVVMEDYCRTVGH